jgi:hypothetical protein
MSMTTWLGLPVKLKGILSAYFSLTGVPAALRRRARAKGDAERTLRANEFFGRGLGRFGGFRLDRIAVILDGRWTTLSPPRTLSKSEHSALSSRST